jgi:transposase-like protein
VPACSRRPVVHRRDLRPGRRPKDVSVPGIDQHGQVIDVLLSARHNLAAARRFFTLALRAGTIPAEVTTDRARPIRESWTN